jgi:ribose/xylose/arabinose/galactoside ABC-type transport system permease subunit
MSLTNGGTRVLFTRGRTRRPLVSAALLAEALLIGFLNGWIVVKTGIPSFLVTLGTFFMLQGLNIALTQTITSRVSSPDISTLEGYSSAQKVFSASFTIGGVNVRTSVLYWIAFFLIATWILLRTRVGNWIFSVGGSPASARAVGVPVGRMKIGLFMAVGLMAWFTGMHTLFTFDTIQAGQGIGNEFVYIIAAVVGGCLLTGGYGSAVGAAIGALIFGMVNFGMVNQGNRGRSIGYYTKSQVTRDELAGLMAGGTELEQLSHELQGAGGSAADVARVLAEEVTELGIAQHPTTQEGSSR